MISHTGEKSEEFSGYSRDLVRGGVDKGGVSFYHDVFPGIRISKTRQSSSQWGLLTPDGREEQFFTIKTGSMMAPPTGSGADC